MTTTGATASTSTSGSPSTITAASRYSSCAGTLAALRLHTADEHLPAALDQATAEGLSVTAALERLPARFTSPSRQAAAMVVADGATQATSSE